MSEPSSSPPQALPAARLFEDNSVLIEARRAVGGEGRDGDVEMRDEELDSAPRDSGPPSRSASPDQQASASPSAGADSRTSTTPPAGAKKSKAAKKEPQLIGDLPRAEAAAMQTFVELPGNHYQYGTLGRSREAYESMTCDCQYEHGVDDPDDACGHDSDCINRLTQVECLPDDCRCRSHCRNQRFQRKQYAPIEIVQTEKKGFGLRAGQNLRKDTFIYEYVGEVVNHPAFLKRLRQYAEDGIRHFYFMMLQKDEYIDATKKGGIGRFANHSCNPNCYVAKWTVGRHVRMGIFANRDIKKDEELTFNYNVDRYGHEAQPCYCGEDKCVGFIGGKTQTDLAAMDDLYLDALGITDEVEALGLKGSKKKKSKKLDEDFIPDLKPILLKDVPKVVQAMRQTQSRKVLMKLLTRIKLTEDQAALRQVMRLRGFSVMTNILEDYAQDMDVCMLAMECMMTWPLIQRNKVEDSQVNVSVQAFSESENQAVAELAKKLLEQWAALDVAYRIPKRLRAEGEEAAPAEQVRLEFDTWQDSDDHALKRPRKSPSPDPGWFKRKLPPQPVVRTTSMSLPMRTPEDEAAMRKYQIQDDWAKREQERKDKVAEMLKAAQEAAEAAAFAPPPLPKEPEESERKKAPKPKQSKEEKEALKEKRLQKLVGAVVVKCLSKYQKQMNHDTFKEHAKHLTQKIADREKKSASYKDSRLEALSDEKVAKIKKFCKEYIATKVIRKLDEGSRHHSSSSKRPSSDKSSRHGRHDPDVDMAHEAHWEDPPSDDENGSDHQPSPEESTSSRRSASETVTDPRVRLRQEVNGFKHQERSPPSPQDAAAVSSRSMVSVGRISR